MKRHNDKRVNSDGYTSQCKIKKSNEDEMQHKGIKHPIAVVTYEYEEFIHFYSFKDFFFSFKL